MQDMKTQDHCFPALQSLVGPSQNKWVRKPSEQRQKQVLCRGVPLAVVQSNQELARLAVALHQLGML